MLVFLELNGVEIECTQTELIEIGLSLANGKMSAEKLTVWLSLHIRLSREQGRLWDMQQDHDDALSARGGCQERRRLNKPRR